MISATSPMFTVFFAKWFLKEPILKIDLINIIIVFTGIILIVKPPFIFGWTELYTNDPQAKWAVLGTIVSCVFLQSNVLVVLRQLKGLLIKSTSNQNNLKYLYYKPIEYILK